MLTDAAMIAMFMQSRPEDGSGPVVVTPVSQWWDYAYEVRGGLFHWKWYAKTPDLNSLHLVEAKLSPDQWKEYCKGFHDKPLWYTLHADAPTRIAGLAEVLRESTEKGKSDAAPK